MKIALLIVATGDYIKYTYPLYDSVRKYFLKDHQVDIFVFTDSKEVPNGTTKIYQEHRAWPYPTLMRFHMFQNNQCFYRDYDYYYYCDSDMLFVDNIGEEIFGDIVAVCHSGFYKRKINDFEYEKNIISSAYVTIGDKYYAGGFQGGRNYLKVTESLKVMVDIDLSKNYVATWHDEAYWNKYLSMYPPDVILDPSYCCPDSNELIEKWGLVGIKPKLIALTKKK
jgi:histo-blood group ABO system transferase